MIEVHFSLAVAIGVSWVWLAYLYFCECHKHEDNRERLRRLEGQTEEIARRSALAERQMVGAWHALFRIRDSAATGRRPSAKSLTTRLDGVINRHWKDRDAARDLMAKKAGEYAKTDSR
jgi:hypothetical protein